MILSGAGLSTIPFGAIPNSTDFQVTALEFGRDVELNGRLAKDLGLKLEAVGGWMTAGARSWPSMSLVARAGKTKTGDVVDAPAELRLNGVLDGATIAEARARADALKALLVRTPVRVITPDAQYRYVVADVATVSVQTFGPHLRQRQLPIELALTAHDPYRYDLTLFEVQGTAGTALPCQLGSAPVRPVLTISGPATNPVVTLREWAGVAIATMTFGATTLLSGDVLVIDCDAGSIAKNGVSALAALTAGGFLQLDPAHADAETPRWPTLATSSGVLAVRYRRAWR